MTESIADVVLAALRGLKRLLEIIRESDDFSLRTSLLPRLDDESARLKVWAGNCGAHLTGRPSLEHRLRDASHIRQQVLRLLNDLKNSLEDAADIMNGKATPWDETEDDEERLDDLETKTELEQIALDITELVNCLMRLSVSIQNPAPHDRFMSSIFTDTSAYEDFDIQHVHAKFQDIDEGLAQRLGKAMSRRRQYFKYREAHHQKLSHGLDRHGDTNKTEPTHPALSTLASSIPLQMKQEVPIDISGDDTQSDERASATSFATSVSGPKTLKVPPMPEDALKGPFMCPFCYLIISVQDTRAWKKHVFGDLRPYNCLAPHCTAPDREFSRRNEWMQHMVQDHLRVYRCPFGCPEQFSSAAESRGHLLRAHSGAIHESKVDSIVELSSQPLARDAHTECPFCPEKLKSLHQYRRHVGNHQQDLALFALPPTEDGDDDSEGSDSIIGHESDDVSFNAHDEEIIDITVQNKKKDTRTEEEEFVSRPPSSENISPPVAGGFPHDLDRNSLTSRRLSVSPTRSFSPSSRGEARNDQLPENLGGDLPPLRDFTPSPPLSLWYDEPLSAKFSEDDLVRFGAIGTIEGPEDLLEVHNIEAVAGIKRRASFTPGDSALGTINPLANNSWRFSNLNTETPGQPQEPSPITRAPTQPRQYDFLGPATPSLSTEEFLRRRVPVPKSPINGCRNCRRIKIACLEGDPESKCWHCNQEGLECITDGIPDYTSYQSEPATYPENQGGSSQTPLLEAPLEAIEADDKRMKAKGLFDFAGKATNEITVSNRDMADILHQNDKGWLLAEHEETLVKEKTVEEIRKANELLKKGNEELMEMRHNSKAPVFTEELFSDSWEADESTTADSAVPRRRRPILYDDNDVSRSSQERYEPETTNDEASSINNEESHEPPDDTATPHDRERRNQMSINGVPTSPKGTKRRSKKERKLISKLGFETVECPVSGCDFETDFPNRNDFERHFRAWHPQNEDLITKLDALTCPNAYCKGMVAYANEWQFRGHMRRVHVIDVKPEGKSSVGKSGPSDDKRDRQRPQKK